MGYVLGGEVGHCPNQLIGVELDVEQGERFLLLGMIPDHLVKCVLRLKVHHQVQMQVSSLLREEGVLQVDDVRVL